MKEEKIVIKGTPPAWDQAEYERRVEERVRVYRGTEKSMELVSGSLGHEFLQAVIDKANQGYTITHTKRLTHGELYHSTYMVKPLATQEEDIANIRAEQKQKYAAHLEDEHARYQDLLRQQLIQTQREKELKTQREKEEKQLAEIEKQVQACYKPLQIPN